MKIQSKRHNIMLTAKMTIQKVMKEGIWALELQAKMTSAKINIPIQKVKNPDFGMIAEALKTILLTFYTKKGYLGR